MGGGRGGDVKVYVKDLLDRDSVYVSWSPAHTATRPVSEGDMLADVACLQ